MTGTQATGQRITEHQLFADIRGPADGPAVLYLHGGPGQGALEFMAAQGDRLAASALRVIGLDQRGVPRSAPLPPDATLTLADLVEDCERVREALGIGRWAILGQSYGGALALRYAAAHPARVSAAVFENPVWDMALSTRAALPGSPTCWPLAAGWPTPARRGGRPGTRHPPPACVRRTWRRSAP